MLRYDISATAFCWQMVRSIVGTLVDVGVGKFRAGDILGMLPRATERGRKGRRTSGTVSLGSGLLTNEHLK